MEDGGRLAPMAPMAAELVDCMAILVACRRFLGMGATDSRSLRSDNHVRMQYFVREFVELLVFLYGVFGGICDVNSCNIFMLLFMVLWVPISATPCKRTVLTLWQAFLFLGLRFFSSFLLFAWWPPLLFLVKDFSILHMYIVIYVFGTR
jgi:hypothetical protein